MKKIVFLVFITIFLYSSQDTDEIIKLVKILSVKSKYQPIQVYNPFLQYSKKEYKKIALGNYFKQQKIKQSYKLKAIFGNRVKINDNWYNIGDKIDGYTIVRYKNNIYLKDGNNVINLTKNKLILKVE